MGRSRHIVLLVLILLLVGVAATLTVRYVAGDPSGASLGETAGADEPPRTGREDESALRGPRRSRERVVRESPDGAFGGRAGERDGGGDSGEAAGERDESDEDEPQDDAEAAPGSDQSDTPPDPGERITRLRGQLVDAGDGSPVKDARVLLAAVVDGKSIGWYGATSRADGTFSHDVPRGWGGPSATFEVRIGRNGYRAETVPATPREDGTFPDLELRLEREAPARPGRIFVVATHPGGTPITGPVLIGGSDADDRGGGLWQWAEANDAGELVLEGVPPGHWRLRLEGAGTWVDARLPDGGETRVHLVGPNPAWPQDIPIDDLERRLQQARSPGRRVTDETAEGDGEEAGASVMRQALRVQDLENQVRARLPRRALVVTGLPNEDELWLRVHAANGPCNYWRARVVDGTARFPGVQLGTWQFQLERPGEARVGTTAGIEAGEGPQTVALTLN